MASEKKNYYEILGIPQNASSEEIRIVFRELSRLYNPDSPTRDQDISEDDCATIFELISKAYAILGDPDKRQQYDQHLKSAAATLKNEPDTNDNIYIERLRADDGEFNSQEWMDERRTIMLSVAKGVAVGVILALLVFLVLKSMF